MFGKIRDELREVHPATMTEETRAGLVADYTAIHKSYQSLVELEESRYESYRYGRLRSRFWTRVRLYLVRVNERAVRDDIARLGGPQSRKTREGRKI